MLSPTPMSLHRTSTVLSILITLTLLISACSTPTPTSTQPTEPGTITEPGGNEPSTAGDSNPDVAETEVVQQPTEASEPVQLVFWHYFTDRAELFEQYSQDYEALTGVKVKMELYSGDALGQKFQAAAQANTLPDLVAAWKGVGADLAPYAKEGIILNLTPNFEAGWADRFVPEHVTTVSFAEGNEWGVEPGPYLVPLDANNMQFLYNKTLFEQAGITDVPHTFSEMLEAGKTLREAGIQPFVAGFGSWAIPSMAGMYQWNVVGQENMEKTFLGEMSYDSQPWIDLLNIFKQMADANFLADGILSYDFPAAESLFVNGQAAIIYDGSWAIGVFNQQNPDFQEYSVFFPPSLEGYDNPLYIPGGVGAQLFAVGTSPHKEEAIKFLQWLTEAKQQAEYANSSFNLPANVEVVDQVPMSEVLNAFAANMDKVPPTLRATMKPAVETTMTKGIQRIIAGEDTPENVVKLMQLAHETEIEQ